MSLNPLYTSNGITVDPATPALTARPLRVVCIGAGFSGLTLAYKLQHEYRLPYVDFNIYEKDNVVGGVWNTNVYPGVGCDLPAHTYVFPFAPNPSWSKFYVGGGEIKQYILDTVSKYDLDKNVIFGTELLRSTWDEEKGKWLLQLQRDGKEITDEADILFNGSGLLHRWKMPDIPGVETFGGKIMHTANWDSGYDWAGKKIAVIGNGSSGLQVVPGLQKTAGRIVNYVRRPTWVSCNICPDVTKDGKGSNFDFTPEEIEKFKHNPEAFLEYRMKVEHSLNDVYRLMLSNSPGNKMLFEAVSGLMAERLNHNQDLLSKLVPKYAIGCRRISPGDGYLEAMQEPNAEWCFDPIERMSEKGIVTAEGEKEFDLIVCATGFNTSFIPGWELIGKGGRRLDEEWKRTPKAYFSMCAAGMPNFFIFAGPNAPVGHGSVPTMIGWVCDYAIQWMEKIATEDIKSAVVKDSVVRDFNRRAQVMLKRTVWSSGCRAWYNNGETVTGLYPGSMVHFKKLTDTIRGEDFEIQYRTSDPFAFLGNGELDWEREVGSNLAYYLK
ncbi:flavin-binding monooxygenase [Penicillium argentinense]|uniref:Flavin-binding monooxygenase n=1 Tax=Penicillium argentinense TaxID=1131581 RepID=A0A9W9G096_9EURO|nr:flavin-binding monooxygenase [Penicillium argentinense]KAJ5109720.1 flavin-binding monooxygenase [Penicillium argentinense]